MLRIMTANLNGIRSAASKGFFDWFLRQEIDVLCIQETKAQEHQLSLAITAPQGYQSVFLDARRPGYSGVALYYRTAPDRLYPGLGHEFLDGEGRFLRADWGNLSISSLYAPSGTSGDARQTVKDDFLVHFAQLLRGYEHSGRQHIICGDYNIAHKAVDLKNWRANQKNSGFLPHERAWFDMVIDEIGFIDAFRCVDERPDQYTWWSARSGARAKNVGWRIDYQLTTSNLRGSMVRAEIAREPFFSDHAPLTITYELDRK